MTRAARFAARILALFFPLSLGQANPCADLQAAIDRMTASNLAMQEAARPFLRAMQLPPYHDGVCAAAQELRNQIAVVASLIDEKCLGEEERKKLAATLEAGMQAANGNIGLFCR